MPASGITVDDDLVKTFNEMKQKKKMHYIKFAVEKEVLMIKEVKSHDEEFDVKTQLPDVFQKDKCCYVVVDLKWQNQQGGEREKLIFISWAPDDAKVKDKMLHSSTKEPFAQKLVGIYAKVQATDFSEVTYQAVLDVAKQNMTSQE